MAQSPFFIGFWGTRQGFFELEVFVRNQVFIGTLRKILPHIIHYRVMLIIDSAEKVRMTSLVVEE